MISAIVPCRNEKDHIESCVRSILAQKLPHGDLEVLVVDGMSEDGTRDILANIAKGEASLRVLDNPSQTTPAALNIGIQASRGQYVAILGAHAEYAWNYLQPCPELLQEHPEVCCAGGPIISRGKGPFGQAVAEAMFHPIGVGNAKHRLPDYEGYAEGGCLPMVRKEIFTKVGLFDEKFICTEDDELNYHFARGGDKVFISPRARCTYFVRETPLRLFRQYFRYGLARVAVLRKYRHPASFRQLVPPGFIGLVLIGLIVGLRLPGWWRLTTIVLPLLYEVALFAGAYVALFPTLPLYLIHQNLCVNRRGAGYIKYGWREAAHAARDRFTTRFGHRHKEEEVCGWCRDAGYTELQRASKRELPDSASISLMVQATAVDGIRA